MSASPGAEHSGYWRRSLPGRYIDVEWRLGEVYIEDGPSDWPRRGHEGSGGTISVGELRLQPDLLATYDGLQQAILADLAPWVRAMDAPRAVLATADATGVPHAVPCCFVVDGRCLYTAIDDVKPKADTPMKRRRNIEENPTVAVLVDEYHDDWERLWWVRFDGTARLPVEQWEIERATALLRAKYPPYASATLDVMAVDLGAARSWPQPLPRSIR